MSQIRISEMVKSLLNFFVGKFYVVVNTLGPISASHVTSPMSSDGLAQQNKLLDTE